MKLTIIGASGHGKVVADIAEKCGYDEIEFLDDNESIDCCGKWRVVSPSSDAATVQNDLFIAIGDARIRSQLMERFSDKHFPVLIHPSAVIADDVEIGEGSVVMAGAVINPSVTIGRGCIVNTCSSVDHDCLLGDYVHLAVGAHLSGTVSIGNRTWIAIGACISNNVCICGDCIIGAGAVVIGDIAQPGVYIGIPAKLQNK